MDPFLPDDTKLDAIRELLPAVASGIRLDITVAGPFPAETDRAIRQSDEHELRVGRGGPDRVDDLEQRTDEARSVVAAVLAATTEQVVLTAGPMAALTAVLVVQPPVAGGCIAIVGDLSTELDTALVRLADASGARIVRQASTVPDDASLVVAAHVDPLTGRVRDPRPLAGSAHAVGARLVLDMGWSAGAIPVDAPGTGADMVLVGTHRWLLGPEGVAVLWLADRALAAAVGGIIDPLPRSQLVGVARSVGWLLMYVSLPWVFERTERLMTRLRNGLADIEGVITGTPERGVAATLPFRVAGWRPADVAMELVRRVHAHVELDETRALLLASVGGWLRDDEIDRFTAAVGEIAAHTPETLPRRPLLTVLAPTPWDER